MLKKYLVVYLICGFVCAMLMILKQFPTLHSAAAKPEWSLLKRTWSFLALILFWPLLCLIVVDVVKSKWQALQSKREQKKREQKAIKYWQHVLKASTESPEFNRLKLTPRCKLYLVESVEQVCSGKTTWFYYNFAIAAALKDFWESGTELKNHIDNSATERANTWAHVKNQGGDICFSRPNSLLYFTNTFEESIQEIYDADERNALSIQIASLDKELKHDPSAVIQQCRISDIIPLCKSVIKGYSVYFMPDVENKKFYLLCVELES